jgi:TetR/AcrR family transcriptional repressor of bet genes
MSQEGGIVMQRRFVRESPDVRRQALIDATALCLAELGAAGTSVRAICSRAGVSSGLLTHYFDGVDALILATYRDVCARVARALEQAGVEAGDDPHARLRAYVLANFRAPVLDAGLLATWIAFWSLVKSNPAMSVVHAEIYKQGRARMEALLHDAAPAMPLAQVRLAAIGLTALVDGLWLELCLDPSNFSASEADRIITDWMDALKIG